MAMDFISGPTNTTAATTGSATIPRSPDSDTDTPPHLPPSKRAHHANGTNSSSGNNHVHVSYKECLKNHAASIGGHALDGCCEFMPGPTSNHVDPTSLTCAACGCHRNFHRRDPDDPTPIHHLIPPSAVARKPHSPPSASQLLLSLSGHTHSPSAPSDHEIAHNPTAVSGGGAVVGFYNNGSGGGGGGQNGNFSQTNNNGNSSSNKKRFRTKFSQEQKEKMYEFSEKIGWKLKKGEERLVEDFCKEVGVDRSVFKVWMHNNKHSSSSSTTITPFSSSQKPEKLADSIPRHEVSHLNNHHSSSSNNNNNNSGSVAMNCGGVLASGIDFNFANGGGQEARAQ